MGVRTFLREHWPILAIAFVALLVLLGLVGTCSQEPSVNEELARSVRVAIESADQARRSNDSAYLSPGRLRLGVIALGVTVPIAAAVVLVYLTTRHRPDETELLTQLEQHGLIVPGRPARQLPSSSRAPELTAGESELDQHRPADENAAVGAPQTDTDKPD